MCGLFLERPDWLFFTFDDGILTGRVRASPAAWGAARPVRVRGLRRVPRKGDVGWNSCWGVMSRGAPRAGACRAPCFAALPEAWL